MLTPLIKALHDDKFFNTFACTREEEAIGIVTGGWMGGMRGAVLMQTSGFATIPNALASLVVPEPDPGAASSCRSAARSANSTSGRRWYAAPCARCSMRSQSSTTPSRGIDELEFILDRSIKQAVAIAGAGHVHPVAAADRRQSVRGVTHDAKAATNAHNAKVMNRFELTKRLVATLKHDEAVIGGIGNANFDLWARGQRPQNFYMLGSMGLTIPIALGVAIAQPQRHVVALEGDGSLLMQLGCLATVAMQAPKNLTMMVWDNGIYQITGSQPTAERHFRRSGRDRARLRACQEPTGRLTKRISTACLPRRSRKAGRA